MLNPVRHPFSLTGALPRLRIGQRRSVPVLFEILSGPGLPGEAKEAILRLPRLSVADGYWERAGSLRGALMAKGLKARAMDCLIAQNCIDNDIPLIASDRDFRHFAACGLQVL